MLSPVQQPNLRSNTTMPIAAPYSMTLRFDFVKSELASLGMTITRKDGEFKVRIKGSPAGNGYFTTDLQDALDTGRAMFNSCTPAALSIS